MVNRNNNGGILDGELNLDRIYGVEDVMDNINQSLENLAGYNLNAADWSPSPQNVREPDNSMNRIQSSKGETISKNMSNTHENMVKTQGNMVANQEPQDNRMAPQLQRQEQTLPTTNNSTNNNRISMQNNNFAPMQSGGNLEAFLRTQVGKNVRMQFLVGTNTLMEKSGILMAVGDNFVILKDTGSGELLVCNFDGIKFIRVEG